ncbi:hypothetical protein PTKIN_Ptkin04bG0145400 [Pterospermum kingtungense]
MHQLQQAAWKLPPLNELKLNVDAGYDRSSFLAYCGLVVRDHASSVILSATKKFTNVQDVLLAEIMAIHFGLSRIRLRKLSVQFVESDSLLAIRELKKKEASLSEWFGLFNDIAMLVDQCHASDFQHVCRGANI